jgi:hypothetical protein
VGKLKMAYKIKSKKPRKSNNAYKLSNLRKEYDMLRTERSMLIDSIKRIRTEKAKYTFADLDSRGKNPYFNMMDKREKKATEKYYKIEKRLDEIDREIDKIQMGR